MRSPEYHSLYNNACVVCDLACREPSDDPSVNLNLHCGACAAAGKMIYYCSPACQKRDWKKGGHRERCAATKVKAKAK